MEENVWKSSKLLKLINVKCEVHNPHCAHVGSIIQALSSWHDSWHLGWDDDDELLVESKHTNSRAETSVITAIDLDTVTTVWVKVAANVSLTP